MTNDDQLLGEITTGDEPFDTAGAEVTLEEVTGDNPQDYPILFAEVSPDGLLRIFCTESTDSDFEGKRREEYLQFVPRLLEQHGLKWDDLHEFETDTGAHGPAYYTLKAQLVPLDDALTVQTVLTEELRAQIIQDLDPLCNTKVGVIARPSYDDGLYTNMVLEYHALKDQPTLPNEAVITSGDGTSVRRSVRLERTPTGYRCSLPQPHNDPLGEVGEYACYAGIELRALVFHFTFQGKLNR